MSPAASVNFAPELALWDQYAHHFPVRERLIYLNHAAVSPLCKPAADAMKHLADDCTLFGSRHYQEWLDAYEGLRVAAARLVGGDRSEIALVKNTSEGIATVAMGLDWKPGDRMVAFREEFPSNYYPWKRLEAKGIQVTWLSVADPLEKIADAANEAKLLAISFVQFLSGYRAPIQAIGEICHTNRCIFLVDAIQGLGAFPLDVDACHIDALAAYLKDESPVVRWQSAFILGNIGAPARTVAPALHECLKDADFQVRLQAQVALKLIAR